jgi:hypothetical protein
MFWYLGSPCGPAKLVRKSLASAAGGEKQATRTDASVRTRSRSFRESEGRASEKRFHKLLVRRGVGRRTSFAGVVDGLRPGGHGGGGGCRAGERRGSVREGNGEGLGEWREEGDKRRAFGGNSEG